MAFARDVYTATGGQTDFTISFSYLNNDDIEVTQNGTVLTETTDYTFPNATTMQLVSGATNGDTIVLTRKTSQSTKLVDFVTGVLTESDLDENADQMFFMAQEAIDQAEIRLGKATDEIWDATSIRIKNVAAPTVDQDAATKKYVDDNVISGGNVPTPDNPGEDDYTLRANGGTFDWQQQVSTKISDMPSSLTALNYIRANAGGTAYEKRTAAQVETDIGGPFAALAANETITADWSFNGTAKGTGALEGVFAKAMRDHISGFITANNGTDAAHDIDFNSGADGVAILTDGTNYKLFASTTTLTKQIDANWAEGDAAGGFPSALTLSVDTWYHKFIIGKDDGTIDYGWDTSLTAANLLSDASTYSWYRRIGSDLTDGSSNILPYSQHGDFFYWSSTDATHRNLNLSTATGTVTTATSVPTGLKIKGYYSIAVRDTSPNTAGWFAVRAWDPDLGSTPPGDGDGQGPYFAGVETQGNGDRNGSVTYGTVVTNASSQINTKLVQQSGGDTNVNIHTVGWEDPRGRVVT